MAVSVQIPFIGQILCLIIIHIRFFKKRNKYIPVISNSVLAHWDSTQFGCTCSLVCKSGRLCLGFCVSRSRQPDIFDLRRSSSQTLICSGRAWFIARRLRNPFLEVYRRANWASLGYGRAPGSHVKKALCYSLVWWDNIQIPGKTRLF